MSVGTSIRNLGTFLEECDDGTGTVHNVELAGSVDPGPGLSADVELTVQVGSSDDSSGGLAVEDVEIDADGRLSLVLETEASVVPASDHDLAVEPRAATVHDDGTIGVSITACDPDDGDDRSAADSRSGTDDSAAECDDSSSTRNRDVPPFRDPELLAEVYDSCETFAEMSEAIDMDVTAETVRRYMIDYDIHEPNRYDTGDQEANEAESDADTEDSAAEADGSTVDSSDDVGDSAVEPDADVAAPVVVTDGLGLPDDLTVDALVETVSRSNTVYEVTRDVGRERDEVLDLLRRLNLIDLVVGRMSREPERNVGRDEILERLREASSAHPQP
ncbi:hypothetical protein [Natrarchaeobaculum sulfurireducens]|uniref:Uncharacterized protein n=1 Tax=Natrarchaeobaculum sulfurireducens TaxID=2044521 RepID=A0A346PBG2_9EURY|nr:hypothetical protein [Natrarchaeobaculum sulfurireducens]AXR76857.1 hypothetical protein AArc1_0513 [Natrarchaeobaculum sulfurireducens]AXR80523.1 hypothetical protein AArcMg_0500 [Natrarchaeobaculum sulfurireducens]